MSVKLLCRAAALLLAFILSQNTFAGSYWGIGGGVSSWSLKPYFGTYELQNGPTLDAVLGLRSGNLGYEGEITFSTHDWVGYSSARHNAANLILAGIGYLPVNPGFEFYGKLGMDYWHTTVDVGAYNFDGDTGFSLVIGGGVKMNINQGMSLRLEYKHMNDLGDGIDKGDINQTTLLVMFDL